MTKIFCTIADKNFKSRVLALNESLYRYNKDYILYLLSLDNSHIEAPNIKVITMQEFLCKDDEVRLNQSTHPSKEAINITTSYEKAQELQFTWSMSPCFTHYCFNNYCDEDLLYIDADIYFYQDWTTIYKQMPENTSIGLVEHRMPWTGDSGKYNVGVLYFKKNKDSEDCLDFWRSCVLHDNEYREIYGTCGDQKYLELFPSKFKNLISLDSYIGHLAPWNLAYHEYTEDQIIWKDKKQDLLYYHYSNFKPDFEKDKYIPAPRHHIHDVSNIPLLHKIHNSYYETLKNYE